MLNKLISVSTGCCTLYCVVFGTFALDFNCNLKMFKSPQKQTQTQARTHTQTFIADFFLQPNNTICEQHVVRYEE